MPLYAMRDADRDGKNKIFQISYKKVFQKYSKMP